MNFIISCSEIKIFISQLKIHNRLFEVDVKTMFNFFAIFRFLFI